MLLPIQGKPLILHTVERAASASTVRRVIVATDDLHIKEVVEEAGHEAVLTSPDHSSGSDRIAEVAERLEAGSIIVNVQGDEPLIDPETIDRAVEALVDSPSASISTTFERISTPAGVLDPNIVKVVIGGDGRALYFSRSPIPFPRDEVGKHGSLAAALEAMPELVGQFKKHTGLYVYRREYLLEFTRFSPARTEGIEHLEQLRALENGAVIRVVEASGSSIGVDTEADLAHVRSILETMDAGGV